MIWPEGPLSVVAPAVVAACGVRKETFSAAPSDPRARSAPLFTVTGALAKLRSEMMPLVTRYVPVSAARRRGPRAEVCL